MVAAVEVEKRFPTGPFASALKTMRVDRGQGAHKWADRDLLAEAEATAGAGAVPLLVATDGQVLEASRANVFVVHEGRLLTPPLDGSILPGIARNGVIEVALSRGVPVGEEPLGLDLLQAAEEVFADGVDPRRGAGARNRRRAAAGGRRDHRQLAAGLRERWFGEDLSLATNQPGAHEVGASDEPTQSLVRGPARRGDLERDGACPLGVMQRRPAVSPRPDSASSRAIDRHLLDAREPPRVTSPRVGRKFAIRRRSATRSASRDASARR